MELFYYIIIVCYVNLFSLPTAFYQQTIRTRSKIPCLGIFYFCKVLVLIKKCGCHMHTDMYDAPCGIAFTYIKNNKGSNIDN